MMSGENFPLLCRIEAISQSLLTDFGEVKKKVIVRIAQIASCESLETDEKI
jgi:hypothetical protein